MHTLLRNANDRWYIYRSGVILSISLFMAFMSFTVTAVKWHEYGWAERLIQSSLYGVIVPGTWYTIMRYIHTVSDKRFAFFLGLFQAGSISMLVVLSESEAGGSLFNELLADVLLIGSGIVASLMIAGLVRLPRR